MGNCNRQNMARRLEDTCTSSPSDKQHKRRHGSSSSSSSSSSTSSSSAAAKENNKTALRTDVNQAQRDQVAGHKAAGEEASTQAAETRVAAESNGTAAEKIERKKSTASATGASTRGTPQANESRRSSSKCQTDENLIGDERSRAPTAAAEAEAAASRLEKLKEGLDFIETEEDVKAVEAATLKIQSTFRGKKIRSKVGAGGAAPAPANKQEEPAKAEAAPVAPKQVNKSAGQREQQSDKPTTTTTTTTKQTSSRPHSHTQQQQRDQDETNELSKRVGNMQVQDNTGQPPQLPGELPEEEAERAATKIQAGFKGYKTRKELEEGGKLPASSAATRQAAPGDNK